MARHRRDPLLEQALLETSLKLGPEKNALRGLLSQLAGSYTRTRRVNASNAAGIREATRQATPQVGGAFAQALQSSQAQRAALGVSGSEPQAAAYERRIMEQQANALTDLANRGARAEEGRVFANQTARDEYFGDKAKIMGQLQELAGRQGAEATARYGQLREAQRGRAVTRRGQTLSSRDRRASLAETQRANRAREAQQAARARESARGQGKIKLASQEQHAMARDSIARGVAAVQDLKQDTQSRAEIVKLLIAGVPAVRKDGVELAPAIKPMSPDYARAAVNMAFDGSLSRGDVTRLRNRRLKLKTLGFPIRRPGAKQEMVDSLRGLAGSVPRLK